MTGIRRLVVALGGNAILRRGDDGTVSTQLRHADATMRHIAGIAAGGHQLVLTHGNGPVVGNIVIRNECARSQVPPMPLFIADADSEGGIGFVLQLALRNRLWADGIDRRVATLVTEVVVDPADPAFQHPTKPIGPYYEPEEAARMQAEEGWKMTDCGEGRMRRVVPSPKPLRIPESDVVDKLMSAGVVVIAAGGGGVPVAEAHDGSLYGVDAVVDKDLSSALLARSVDAEVLAILMEADAVYADWGTERARALRRTTPDELEELAEAGQFPAGGMLPKVEAVISFVRRTGKQAIVCSAESLLEALDGAAGTVIVPDGGL